MAAKIMILSSSPNKNGNTNTVVSWVVEGARKAGATVKCVDVARITYKAVGCTACMACQESEKFECVIKDEATEIVKRMVGQDAVVFATPIYFFGPNAPCKAILDRMFCLVKFSEESGEYTCAPMGGKLGLIATAGGGLEDSGLKTAEEIFRRTAAFGGIAFHSLLVPHAPSDAAALAKDTQLKKRALAFGKELTVPAAATR
jgi:multimeric flavodoxin WrbA